MASVFLGDLDDFIAPSQACVNPLFAAPASDKPATLAGNGADAMELVLEDEFEALTPQVLPPQQQEPDLIKTSASKTATVSLNDCLACSGCVTSAETVLISQQSSGRLLSALRDKSFAVSVASLSPQSRASIADHFGLSPAQAQARIATFLAQLGVTHTIDAACAGDLCLVAARDEFIARARSPPSPLSWAAPPPSVAVSRTMQRDAATGAESLNAPQLRGPLPLLVSACPGFVCYVEKTAPEALAYVSAVKSPQAVAGALVKGAAARAWGVAPAAVLHLSVQPCFDRKLEASRLDFVDDAAAAAEAAAAPAADVDIVLSTSELLEMVWERAGGEAQAAQYFRSLAPAPPAAELAPGIPLPPPTPEGAALASADAAGGASGGYAEHVFRHAAKVLHGVDISQGAPLQYRQGRNVDMRELVLEVGGEVVMRFALAYGFRNIQSILTQLRRRRCAYQYVEVMACPGGCVNGGGQVRPAQETPQAMRERTARVGGIMQAVPSLAQPDDSPLVQRVLGPGGAMPSDSAASALHTTFHAVPKLEATNSLLARW